MSAYVNLASDGPIDGFRGGWAFIPFAGRLTHNWTQESVDAIGPRGRVRFWRSACGVDGFTHDGVPALGEGDFRRCKRCLAKAPA